MTVPHWLRNETTVLAEHDWLVIGAGVTGLSAALALTGLGEDCLLIDRETVGRRASTRNAGYLMRGAAENYALACERYGRDRAAQLWRLTEENLAALRELGVENLPSYRPTPSCLLALDAGEADELTRSHEMLLEDGFASRWIADGDDAAWKNASPLGGLLNPDDATCNPAELIGMLRDRFSGSIRENTPVAELRSTDDGVEALVPGGILRAKRVIICTNAYAAELGPALPTVEPNRGQMLALRVPGPMLEYAYYSDRGSEYYRQADERTVVVGGRRKHDADAERTSSESTSREIQEELESFAERVLGDRYPVVARWAGTMGFTATGLPVIAPCEPGGPWGPDGRIWFVGGMNGHGMSMAVRTAQLAVSHLTRGTENPFPPDGPLSKAPDEG